MFGRVPGLLFVLAFWGCDHQPALPCVQDADRDGFAAAPPAGCPAVEADAIDCDDDSMLIHPAAFEQCGGIDEDCDGLIDNHDPDVVGAEFFWYADEDGDGSGDASRPQVACAGDPPVGFVALDGDCDDNDPEVFAGHGCQLPCAEPLTWLADRDGDGFGDDKTTILRCRQPEGWVADGGDCEDGDPKIHPQARESCNSFDDDCDGMIDEVDSSFIDPTWRWWADADGDGFGDEERPVVTCSPFPGFGLTDRTGDCDDDDEAVHPGAVEWCDAVDQDCDGVAWLPDTATFETAAGREDWSAGLWDPPDAGTLHLCEGRFVGSLTTAHGLVVQGHGDAVWSGEGEGSLLVAAGELHLQDLTLRGGGPLDAAVVHTGATLHLERTTLRDHAAGALRTSALEVSATGVEFIGNTAPTGAALRLEAARVEAELVGVHLVDNRAQDGGAIAAAGAGSLTLRLATFEVNTGGSVLAPSLDSLVIEDSLFVGNTADRIANVVGAHGYTRLSGTSFAGNLTRTGPAAGVWMSGTVGNVSRSELDLRDVSFVGQIGGALAARSVVVHAVGGVWADNHAGHGGAALRLDGEDVGLDMVGTMLRGNTVDGGGAGGALLLEGSGWAALLDVHAEGNVTGGQGGALALLGGWEVACDRTALLANQASRGGAVWMEAMGGKEPAFYAFSCDFGATGNLPDDVATPTEVWHLPGVVDAGCTWNDGCR